MNARVNDFLQVADLLAIVAGSSKALEPEINRRVKELLDAICDDMRMSIEALRTAVRADMKLEAQLRSAAYRHPYYSYFETGPIEAAINEINIAVAVHIRAA